MNNNLEVFKSSVRLCAKRLSLISEINEIDNMLNENFMLDRDFINYYAKNYINKGNPLLRLIISGLPILTAGLIMPKYNLSNESGTIFAVGTAILCAIIFIALSLLNKIQKRKIVKRDYLPNYAERRDAIVKSRNDLKAYKAELQQELSELIQIMQDRNICVIHPNYWDDALKIWSLVELGRATSLASAINLFESQKRENQRDAVLQQQLENSQRALESQIRSERYAQEAAENSSRAELYSLFAFTNSITN